MEADTRQCGVRMPSKRRKTATYGVTIQALLTARFTGYGPFSGLADTGTVLAMHCAEVCRAQLDKNKSLRAGGFAL